MTDSWRFPKKYFYERNYAYHLKWSLVVVPKTSIFGQKRKLIRIDKLALCLLNLINIHKVDLSGRYERIKIFISTFQLVNVSQTLQIPSNIERGQSIIYGHFQSNIVILQSVFFEASRKVHVLAWLMKLSGWQIKQRQDQTFRSSLGQE